MCQAVLKIGCDVIESVVRQSSCAALIDSNANRPQDDIKILRATKNVLELGFLSYKKRIGTWFFQLQKTYWNLVFERKKIRLQEPNGDFTNCNFTFDFHSDETIKWFVCYAF